MPVGALPPISRGKAYERDVPQAWSERRCPRATWSGRATRTGTARINRAIAGETVLEAKYRVAESRARLPLSGGANLWQGQQSKIQVVHVVHDTVGNIITAQPEGSGQFKPSPAQIGAALRAWVANVRTVYIDVNAMRRSIPAAFDIIASGSQARGLLNQFYQSNDPFKRAALETVSVSNVTAIPPPPATLGKDDLQTWRVQWVEQVTGRDGLVRSITNQVVTVTLTVTIPKSLDEATSDPDGIHIISFAWAQQ